MYRLECDDTSITNGYNVGGLLPWSFIPSPRENHENYVLTIKPKFYARFSDFSIETVSPYPFDKSKVALVGTNTFNINGFVSPDVKADPNYGVLYTQAPVSYVDADDGEETINEDLIDGEVSLVNNGKAHTHDIRSSFFSPLRFRIALSFCNFIAGFMLLLVLKSVTNIFKEEDLLS